MTRSFDVSLFCAWTNGWVNNRDAGDLRCHHAHYDVTVALKAVSLHVASFFSELMWGCKLSAGVSSGMDLLYNLCYKSHEGSTSVGRACHVEIRYVVSTREKEVPVNTLNDGKMATLLQKMYCKNFSCIKTLVNTFLTIILWGLIDDIYVSVR